MIGDLHDDHEITRIELQLPLLTITWWCKCGDYGRCFRGVASKILFDHVGIPDKIGVCSST